MSLQNLLDDIFGEEEVFPGETYGDNADRTEQRVGQLEGLEEQPIDELPQDEQQ